MRSTFRPEVVGDIGGFGGLFAFEPKRFDHPLLVSSTDGVGTKSMIARLTGRYDTIGIDLVAMSVDDIAVPGRGAALLPRLHLDRQARARDRRRHRRWRRATGVVQAGCALLGGEMSEHPDLMEPGEFDLVGFAVGVVERARVLPQQREAR